MNKFLKPKVILYIILGIIIGGVNKTGIIKKGMLVPILLLFFAVFIALITTAILLDGELGDKPRYAAFGFVTAIALVERKTRKTLYILIKNKSQKEVIRVVGRARKRVSGDFSEVFKTITADNGSEFLDSEAIKSAAKCSEIYYAHPYSSWERGSNENGNRILRRFIPKGTDIGRLTEKELQRIEDWVNNYPRKIHGYKTADEVLAA